MDCGSTEDSILVYPYPSTCKSCSDHLEDFLILRSTVLASARSRAAWSLSLLSVDHMHNYPCKDALLWLNLVQALTTACVYCSSSWIRLSNYCNIIHSTTVCKDSKQDYLHFTVIDKHAIDFLDRQCWRGIILKMYKSIASRHAMLILSNFARKNGSKRLEELMQGAIVNGLVKVFDEDVVLARAAQGRITLGPHDAHRPALYVIKVHGAQSSLRWKRKAKRQMHMKGKSQTRRQNFYTWVQYSQVESSENAYIKPLPMNTCRLISITLFCLPTPCCCFCRANTSCCVPQT